MLIVTGIGASGQSAAFVSNLSNSDLDHVVEHPDEDLLFYDVIGYYEGNQPQVAGKAAFPLSESAAEK